MQQLHRKLDVYFQYGTRMVWIINWQVEQIHIYRPESIVALTQTNDVLSGDEVLRGFKCRLRQIFRPD